MILCSCQTSVFLTPLFQDLCTAIAVNLMLTIVVGLNPVMLSELGRLSPECQLTEQNWSAG